MNMDGDSSWVILSGRMWLSIDEGLLRWVHIIFVYTELWSFLALGV
jgi:hypothetical protein